MTRRHSCLTMLTCAAALAIAALAAPPRAAAADKTDWHIKRKSQIRFSSYYVMNDGAGYRWDIQYYGSVYRGTTYAYSGGMYCQVNGSNVQANNQQGWVNEAGDEIEIGPCNRSGLMVSRRIKVYKDLPLARWLDVFVNPTNNGIVVNVQIVTNTRYSVRSTITSSGGAAFSEKDFAFRTVGSSTRSIPTLHVVTNKGAKLRPAVQISSSQIYLRYNLAIPAKKTVILCHFESQHREEAKHLAMMKKFDFYKVMKDLPPSVRAKIINMRISGGFVGVDLTRSASADTVMIAGGGPKYGRITNKSFTVQSVIGPLTLPASHVIGMAAVPGDSQIVRFALADGQVISAGASDESIALNLPTGGTLKIPISRVTQWSYQISRTRPADAEAKGAFVRLRTGDRLALNAKDLTLKFRTRYGLADVPAESLVRITMDLANGVHHAHFVNGSRLGGILQPQRISLALTLGQTVSLNRHMLAELSFAEEEQLDTANLSHVTLTNEDELYGRFTQGRIVLTTEFGPVELKPSNVKAMTFSTTRLGWVTLTLWNNSRLAGRLEGQTLAFLLQPGPTLHVSPVQMVSVTCPNALPPDRIIRKARMLIARLAAESLADRRDAQEKLIQLGEGIAPLLRENANTTDPEVRQRIVDILDAIGMPLDPNKPKLPPWQPNMEYESFRKLGLQQAGFHKALAIKVGC